MRLRNSLEKYLKDSGLTAAALAKEAGVPKATLAGWLSGSAPRDLSQLKAVANIMGTTIDGLLFDEPRESLVDQLHLIGLKPDRDGWFSGHLEIRVRGVGKFRV